MMILIGSRETRVRFGGSSAGHKGVSSIIDALGTDSFLACKGGHWRPFSKQEVINYVLGEPRRMRKKYSSGQQIT